MRALASPCGNGFPARKAHWHFPYVRAEQAAEKFSTKDTASRAVKKLMFVSGHDFSRAVNNGLMRASAPEVLLSRPVQSFSAACSAVPQPARIDEGFQPLRYLFFEGSRLEPVPGAFTFPSGGLGDR